jgi:rhodanese-related sulfurtransferase
MLFFSQPKDFFSGHVAGSLSFSLGGAGGVVVGAEDGNFAIWVGTLVANTAELLIVSERGKEGETLQRLSRIAYTNVKGVLKGGIEAYREAGLPLESFNRIDLRAPETSLDSLLSSGHRLLDVRTEGEFQSNTATSAANTPLATLPTQLDKLDRSSEYVAFCVSGYRSAIATSLLRRAGFRVRDIHGGFAAISWTAPSQTTSGKVS